MAVTRVSCHVFLHLLSSIFLLSGDRYELQCERVEFSIFSIVKDVMVREFCDENEEPVVDERHDVKWGMTRAGKKHD